MNFYGTFHGFLKGRRLCNGSVRSSEFITMPDGWDVVDIFLFIVGVPAMAALATLAVLCAFEGWSHWSYDRKMKKHFSDL